MKIWRTEIQAIDSVSGELRIFAGQYVSGFTLEHAQQYCNENGLSYCVVKGEVISEETELGKINIKAAELN